ncbi:6-bladed beta-propeller [Patescibacteria group bacterium]|nr:6-bladed beta-propeller [Patescibacteria group bacterium]MBU1890509.1 6-bladed beta-propeller [Patescibacteria group bacterium]
MLKHIICLLVAMTCSTLSPASSSDDVTRIVNNPAEPESSVVIQLTEKFRIGEDEDDELISHVRSVFLDSEGNICILDSHLKNLLIYNQSGELLRHVGRKGAGPGEYEWPSSAFWLNGQYVICQAYPGKFILFYPDGIPAGNLKLDIQSLFLPIMEAGPVGDGLLGAFYSSIVEKHRHHDFSLFNLNGDMVQNIYHWESEESMIDDLGIYDEMCPSQATEHLWTVTSSGTIYMALSFTDYTITVQNIHGDTLMMIQRDYESIKRSSEEVSARYQRREKWNAHAPRPPKVAISEQHRDIQQIQIGPDGLLWVLPSNGVWKTPPGTVGIYDVFDEENVYVKRVALRGEGVNALTDGVWILSNGLVVVAKNQKAAHNVVEPEETETSIICFTM